MKKLATTLFLLFVTAIMFADVSEKERNALIDFYNATQGPNWVTPWNIETSVNQWHGITVKNNTVIGISLLFNNVTGTIPASLGNLQHLETLELSFNKLSGTLPTELGKLTSLKLFAVNGNDIYGKIPEALGNLTSLKELHLSSNKLTGELPSSLGGLQNLEVLNVFDNQLKGEIPSGFIISKSLKQVVISKNDIQNTENFANVILFDPVNTPTKFKQPTISPVAKSVIAIETSDDEN